jgi:hypothetical protein
VSGAGGGPSKQHPNSHISFGGPGAALNPPPAYQPLLLGQPRPSPPVDPYAQNLHHTAAAASAMHHSNMNHNNQQQHGGYQNASMQAAESLDDRGAYVKYSSGAGQGDFGGGARAGGAGGAGGAGRGPGGMGLGPRTRSATGATLTAGTGGGSGGGGGTGLPAKIAPRRPQSALDRPPTSRQSTGGPAAGAGNSSFANNKTNSNNNSYNTLPLNAANAPAGGGGGGAGVGANPSPAGLTVGMYNTELKALMGSAAYNRPVSAPQNHRIQVEETSAYQETMQRIKLKEERARVSNIVLENTYKGNVYGGGGGGGGGAAGSVPQRPNVSTPGGLQAFIDAKLSSTPYAASIGGYAYPNNGPAHATSSNNNNVNMSATAPAVSAASANANVRRTPGFSGASNNLTAVERALSIGRSSAAFFPTPAGSGGARGGGGGGGDGAIGGGGGGGGVYRTHSANATGRGQGGGGGGGFKRNMDPQARLNEMFDDGIIDKLDIVIGGGGGRR